VNVEFFTFSALETIPEAARTIVKGALAARALRERNATPNFPNHATPLPLSYRMVCCMLSLLVAGRSIACTVPSCWPLSCTDSPSANLGLVAERFACLSPISLSLSLHAWAACIVQ